ncbi:LacI family DNA-binding transcriptional regulator [Bacillus massilinigeriensis]|uniref:LacI family DNA-binding transcriptional regulator n=1 Tax=Bacillus mediterraneensis TaxID=1805474 RepID=UPI0008F9355A|nr:LacI family DNA-binding transcriptional regulator [Bacillus mediterraneensis]
MLTIKEIAEMANVSRATVSRVLNASGYVSEAARKRVLEVVEKTGYVPSQHAKSLRTKQTKVIGVILPKISTETSSRIVDGMNDVFSKQGFQILLTTTNLEPEKEIEYIRLLKSRQVDGIVLFATNINAELITEIEQLQLPFVAIGQDIPGVCSVTYEDFQSSKTMVKAIIEKGYKNIAFIGVDESDRAVGLDRKQGFLKSMEEHNLVVRKEWVKTTNFDIPSGYEAMKIIMEHSETKEIPDAVFAVTDRIAIGAMQYLKEVGYKIPDQIAVSGMGAADISQYVQPALTTIEYENQRAGKEAALLLLDQIVKNERNDKKVILGYRLIIRDSI